MDFGLLDVKGTDLFSEIAGRSYHGCLPKQTVLAVLDWTLRQLMSRANDRCNWRGENSFSISSFVFLHTCLFLVTDLKTAVVVVPLLHSLQCCSNCLLLRVCIWANGKHPGDAGCKWKKYSRCSFAIHWVVKLLQLCQCLPLAPEIIREIRACSPLHL